MMGQGSARVRPARVIGARLLASTALATAAWAGGAQAQDSTHTAPSAVLQQRDPQRTSDPAAAAPPPASQADTAREPNAAPGEAPPIDAPADASGDVVVTGIRRGIADSIAIKRKETSIVEAISAEDIGKLPDTSIADSIARLPGLAAQRVNGRAQVISIRGLSPDFTTTLLNGRQQASSGDNRAVEFDQYPAELLSSVVVYKTPDADIAGFGLSGSVDLRTVRPLEFGKRALALNIRGEHAEGHQLNAEIPTYGYRGTVSYIDQFADGKLGVAFGYARLYEPTQTRHYQAYDYGTFSGLNAVSPASADGDLFVNGQEVFATSQLNVRDAAIGIVEWKPSDVVHMTLDSYYSQFHQNTFTRGAQWFSNPYADGQNFSNVQTSTIGGSKVGLDGTQNNVIPIIRNDNNRRADHLVSIGLNTEFQVADKTKFITDLAWSRNHRVEQILETYAGYGLGVGGVTPNSQGVGRTNDSIKFHTELDDFPTYGPGLNYADASHVSLGDRAPWGGWGHDGAVRYPDVEENIYSLDLELQQKIDSPINGIDLGVNWTRREKTKTVDEYDLFLKNGRQQTLVDPKFLTTPTDVGFAGFGKVLSFNPTALLGTYYNIVPIMDANFYDKSWTLQEDVITWHAKATLDFWRFTGNIGVQAVYQGQRSTGLLINQLDQNSAITPTKRTVFTDYIDVLPSANLIFNMGSGMRLRFAAAKTTARPRVDDLRANVTPGFNSFICNNTNPVTGKQGCTPGQVVNPFTASGGNPTLRPWRADALDVSYEWYVKPTTYLAIAGFYKHLNSYIYTRNGFFDFSGVPLPIGAQAILSQGAIISPIGQISQPANGNGGNLKGVEFSGSIDFGILLKPLRGLGAQGSLSLTDSNLSPSDDPLQPTKIPGLSNRVYNITAFYERDGFQLRVSQRYRSGFKGEVVQLFAVRGFTEILADRQMDGQIGYSFQHGPLNGFGALFQVLNMTNAPYRTRLGLDSGGTKTGNGGSLLNTYEQYGRQFLFGINYRF